MSSVDDDDQVTTLQMYLRQSAELERLELEDEASDPDESLPTKPLKGERLAAMSQPRTNLDRPTELDRAAKFADSPMPIPDRYKVKRRLGRGGMGDVLEAHDDHLGRDVAVKLLAPKHWSNRSVRERLLREGRAAAVLDHPAIVKVHDLDPNGRYIVMELVRGDSLDTRLTRRKRFEPEEVRNIGLALCDALAAAHAAGIVHRDIKPANILFDERGRVRLADFGVASVIDSDLTATDAQIGTPAYMAPEQLRSAAVDQRADIYSTGATLFEAATGIRLHGSSAVRDPRKTVVDVTGDKALARAIARAVAEELDDRYQTIDELSADLVQRKSGGGRIIGLVAAGAISAALAVGIVAMLDRRGDESVQPEANSEQLRVESAEPAVESAPPTVESSDPPTEVDPGRAKQPLVEDTEFGAPVVNELPARKKKHKVFEDAFDNVDERGDSGRSRATSRRKRAPEQVAPPDDTSPRTPDARPKPPVFEEW